MPDTSTSVDDAVEKMIVGKAPVESEDAAKETPDDQTPAKETSDEGKQSSDSAEAEAGALTAFEQELIAELDEDDRKAFDEAAPEQQKRDLAFMKKQYRRTAKQMTELGTLRKAIGTLRESGVTNEDLVELVSRKRGGKPADSTPRSATGTDGQRGFNRWHAKAEKPEERESLREAEQVIREVVEDVVSGLLDKEVKPIRERLDSSDRQMLSKRSQSLDSEINALEDELGYPGSLVETHRHQMAALGLREPELSAEDLLVRVAGFQTVKAAMLKIQAKTNGEKEETPSKPSASIVKKPVQPALPRDRGGVISITRALDLLMKPKR